MKMSLKLILKKAILRINMLIRISYHISYHELYSHFTIQGLHRDEDVLEINIRKNIDRIDMLIHVLNIVHNEYIISYIITSYHIKI